MASWARSSDRSHVELEILGQSMAPHRQAKGETSPLEGIIRDRSGAAGTTYLQLAVMQGATGHLEHLKHRRMESLSVRGRGSVSTRFDLMKEGRFVTTTLSDHPYVS